MGNIVGIIYGDMEHYIDHMAPLCALMKMPLLTNELRIKELVEKFYPSVEVIYKGYLHFPIFLVKNFDIVFYCFLHADFEMEFGMQQDLLKKKLKTIWCPHGNSDKGWHQEFMEALNDEPAVLLYGKKMYDYVKKKGVHLRSWGYIGNYRYDYYLQHKKFYQKLVKDILGEKNCKTILYAPTWHDCEDSCSFLEVQHYLLKKIPDNMRLIIKLHPNTFVQHEIEVDKFLDEYQDNKRVFFLRDFTCIYPLLDYVDVYLGDMSSIGYDFLTFDKPLFFLNKNSRNKKKDLGLYLYRCGEEIALTDYENIYDIIKEYCNKRPFKHALWRKKTYEYTFGNS
jgi:hypothetical protein